ncbi:hypothetical protein GBAR_LOCUS5509 [Geodia barretti]|uniref:Uncharacterized protein n=1 Tax=Geodia barretti TaxID=519541 RepID=A0AA35RC65_GEOBA|nr:hypothetical protein GBAR_LOCUS5509 [Geodia barretti]
MVAEILGTDAEETADAITQAKTEVREEIADAALEDLAGRVAEILETDADATADALEKVSEDMFDEALESKLQDAIDDGRITEEQAQEYRDKAEASGSWYGFGYGRGHGHRGGNSEEFANRVGEELDVEGDDVADAIKQAQSDIRTEAFEGKLDDAVESGRITQDEADEILESYESGSGDGFHRRGRSAFKGGKGHWGRGRGSHHGSDTDPTATPEPDPTATPEPASDGDSA